MSSTDAVFRIPHGSLVHLEPFSILRSYHIVVLLSYKSLHGDAKVENMDWFVSSWPTITSFTIAI